jgi:hypothetical protein
VSDGKTPERNEFDLPEDDFGLPSDPLTAADATGQAAVVEPLPLPGEPAMAGVGTVLAAEGVADVAAEPAAKPKKERKPREPGQGLFGKLQQASLDTVLLGISLAAILVAILMLLLAWSRYDFAVKATASAASAAPAAYSSADSTTTV